MLYAIPAAVLTAALAAACWRCWTLRRALIWERVVASMDRAAWARDIAALETAATPPAPMPAPPSRACRDAYVLAQTALIIDAAYAAALLQTDIQEGGTDGRP